MPALDALRFLCCLPPLRDAAITLTLYAASLRAAIRPPHTPADADAFADTLRFRHTLPADLRYDTTRFFASAAAMRRLFAIDAAADDMIRALFLPPSCFRR